jgi:GTP-binding protein YchF
MQLGIIGLPNSGKTTVFNALTGSNYETSGVSGGKMEVNTAVVNVPDLRVDELSAIFNPKKITYPTITYVDVAGLEKGMGEEGLPGPLRNALSPVDGFIHVLRAFEDDTVPHPQETLDPQRDLETINTEFLLTDLITIENRLSRLNDEVLKKGKKATGRSTEEEIELLTRLRDHLEEGAPLRDMELTDDEKHFLKGFGLLTLKPQVIVVNTEAPVDDPTQFVDIDHHDTVVLALPAQIESEIAQLDEEDRELFMQEYGITEPGANRVVRASYDLMNIQTFFTVGEDEVRGWSVHIGAFAPQAAGVIHSDLQRGFIRAECITYDDFVAYGSMAKAKTEGKVRLEGKQYVVQDGDIMNIRFSV